MKCYACGKKLSLVQEQSNKCRCGGTFCASHREAHACSFDYVASGAEWIKKTNPVIHSAKLRDSA